jgi:hypothetical protein
LLSHLVCFGRHTITGLLRLQDRTQQDWTADYRFYAEDRFDEEKVFAQVRGEIEEQLSAEEPLVVAMDDSLLRKTGRKICGVRYLRDPMSPPFHVNFVRGLRVLQVSAAVPEGAEGAARLIPVAFEQAALPAKPRQNAAAHLHEAYAQERARKNINLVGRQRLALLRQQMDESGSAQRPLIVSIDGRFTNSTVLGQVPERTTLIGRVRKDSAFFHPPQEQPSHGRKRKYGLRTPTPEELLHHEQIPWQEVQAYASGKRHQFEVKTLSPIYSQMDKAQQPLRLIVIKPVRYRLSKTQTDRREPAFLICTDPNLPLEKVLQYYLWRWDIEVNFRDEKTILGVGQAQVRSEASNQNAPALAVAAYSILLLAAIKTYGQKGKPEIFKIPRWHKCKSAQRASTNDLRNQVRYELWSSALRTHFPPLCSSSLHHENGRKCDLPLESALFDSIK